MFYTAYYRSSLGNIMLSSDGEALTGLFFDGQRYFGSTIGAQCVERLELPVFDKTFRWLDIYFSGREPDLMPPLSLKGTPFQQRVWKELLTIPYGQTVTYGELARRLGCRSAQAVGGAVGRNPISIIVPCHRVVGACYGVGSADNGSLTGYAGGIEKKRALLGMEKSA